MTGTDRRSPAGGRTDPVTVLVERRVLPGKEEEFRSWAYGILAEAAGFPGYLGGGVLHPTATDDRWHLVYRFTDQASLHAWESSPHNERCLHHGGELHELVRTRHLSGMEDLFALPDRAVPPRWKLTLVAAAAVYPLSLLADVLLMPYTGGLPPVLRNALIALFFSTAMTYVLLPALSRVLRRWLSGPPPSSAPHPEDSHA
ncbi:antibiotic biosynthesis monooxygenase [Streptomyces sp. ICN441]|uniref:antibiotic biosynthesis monooxygenase n=1 Tax=Streptomyces sp. ICN441 TaxID=2558286 RepID=UPI00141B297B|nr:antibiotic biosynthesis monooxygenase [Streptomyces sp. ICN441]